MEGLYVNSVRLEIQKGNGRVLGRESGGEGEPAKGGAEGVRAEVEAVGG